MSSNRVPRVLVLYVHPLLGQGLARLLTRQAGVNAIAVPADDPRARTAAFHRRPDLVIVEGTADVPAVAATDSLPVVFVRIDSDDGGQLGQPLSDPDLIVALARGLAEVPDPGASLVGSLAAAGSLER